MNWHTFRMAATAVLLASVITAFTMVQAKVQQSAAPKALDAGDAVTYFIAEGNGQTGYRSTDNDLALWALQAWQRAIGKNLRLQSTPESSAIVRVYWGESDEGMFGEMQPLDVGGRRGAAVYIRPNVESMGPELADRARADALLRDSIVYLTCLHELGHALGLDHTRDFADIMYYFGYGGNIVTYFNRYRSQLHTRNDIATVSGLSESDISRIKALYARQ